MPKATSHPTNHVASARRSRSTNGKRTQPRLLLTGLTLLAAGAALVLFVPPVRSLAVSGFTAAAAWLLGALGYALAPGALWVAAFLAAVRYRRRLLWRWWRWFASTALLIAAAAGALSYFQGDLGPAGYSALGGQAGLAVQGDALLLSLPRVAAAALIGFWVLTPRWSILAARLLAQALGRLIALLLALLRAGAWVVRRTITQARTWRKKKTPGLEASSPAALASATTGTPRFLLELADDDAEEAAVAESSPPAPQEHPGEEVPAPSDNAPAQPAQQEVPAALQPSADAAPQQAVGTWELPPMTVFKAGGGMEVNEEEKQETAQLIEETMRAHGIEVAVTQIRPGPTVTMYGVVPGWVRRYREAKEWDEDGNVVRDERGRPVTSRVEDRTRVKVDSILAREKDLALALAAPSLRIEAPVPGESVVGVEVPNATPATVTFRSVVESTPFQRIARRDGLAIPLGQAAGGDAVAADLVQMPHLLIAGATGSGKSVCMNTVIAALLCQATPLDLRLLLIDPKRVELTPYNGIPHLVTPVMVDPDQVVRTLKGLIQEMFRRYRRMEELGVRNIQAYNRKLPASDHMPYLVVCMDEMADLMMAAPYDVERTICRLAQLGRATGIHLIVATQRPSVDVVTGLIKANFPSRISFAVASQVDSRTILDTVGADRLLGRGDMLLLTSNSPKPRRVQGALISDSEIHKLVMHWRSQNGPMPPHIPLEELAREAEEHEQEEEAEEGFAGPRDSLLEKAIELASRYNQLSTSLLQRRLRIGYPRAARLMDQLEDTGVVGPGEAGKPRDVLSRALVAAEQPGLAEPPAPIEKAENQQ